METLQQLKRHPILFLLGCALTFACVLAISLLSGLFFGLDPQMIGRGMAGVVLVTFVPGGIAFVKFVERWRQNRHVYLDSTHKRKFFLLVPLGLAMLPLSWIFYRYEFGGYFALIFSPANWPYREGGNLWAIVFFWLGMSSILAGLLFSYFYDVTLGRIQQWIKAG